MHDVQDWHQDLGQQNHLLRYNDVDIIFIFIGSTSLDSTGTITIPQCHIAWSIPRCFVLIGGLSAGLCRAQIGASGVFKKAKVQLWPSWPASSPWVTSVGATRFIGQKVGNPEMATDQFGSGGGFSSQFDQTDAQYQAAAVAKYGRSPPPTPVFLSNVFWGWFGLGEVFWHSVVSGYVTTGIRIAPFGAMSPHTRRVLQALLALLGAHADRMLIGACNLMLCPIPLFRYLSTVDASTLPPAGSFPPLGRATPDVAALGEGFQVVVDGKPMPVGGTSASSPTFAGLVSLLNEVRHFDMFLDHLARTSQPVTIPHVPCGILYVVPRYADWCLQSDVVICRPALTPASRPWAS